MVTMLAVTMLAVKHLPVSITIAPQKQSAYKLSYKAVYYMYLSENQLSDSLAVWHDQL